MDPSPTKLQRRSWHYGIQPCPLSRAVSLNRRPRPSHQETKLGALIHPCGSRLHNWKFAADRPLTMSSNSSHERINLSESSYTMPSDSENYDGNHEETPSPLSSSSSPLILYSPPTFWGLLRGAAINLFLPFVNGLMLGFGELVANELAFRFGWSGTKVRLEVFRSSFIRVGC